MGLFGDQDAHEVNDNPFYVAPDTYQCVLTDFTLRQTQKGGHGLSWSWTVEDDDSEYYQQPISDWITVYLSLEAEEEAGAQQVRRDRAALKARLTQIGMTTDEMDELLDEETLTLNEDLAEAQIGKVAFVEVRESKSKKDPDKTYSNVAKVTLVEDAA